MEFNNNNAKDGLKPQLDAIKHGFYKFIDEKMQEYGIKSVEMELSLRKYNKDLCEFMKKTEKKVNTLLAKIDSSHELRLNLVLVKCFCIIRGLLALKASVPDKFVMRTDAKINQCQSLLKPYKKKAEGAWLNMMIQVVFGNLMLLRGSSSCSADARKALNLIEVGEDYYSFYARSEHAKPWGINEVFCCYDAQGNQLKRAFFVDFQNHFDSVVKKSMLELAMGMDDEDLLIKHGVAGLKVMLKDAKDHKSLHKLVRFARAVVEAFNEDSSFTQAQHIAAVVMVTVVEFRRSLPEHQRKTVNPIHYEAAYLYVNLGNYLLMEYSFSGMFMEESYGENRYDCVRLMPESDILLEYERQFGVSPSRDITPIKPIKKRYCQWIDRMEEFEKTNTAPPGLCLSPYFNMRGELSGMKESAALII